MNLLVTIVEKMLDSENPSDKIEIEEEFIEVLTFSSYQEIVEMLDIILEKYWTEFPVWARNLAFRLACLLAPENSEIRYRAAADIRCFGPDWDAVADRLDKEAKDMEIGQ